MIRGTGLQSNFKAFDVCHFPRRFPFYPLLCNHNISLSKARNSLYTPIIESSKISREICSDTRSRERVEMETSTPRCQWFTSSLTSYDYTTSFASHQDMGTGLQSNFKVCDVSHTDILRRCPFYPLQFNHNTSVFPASYPGLVLKIHIIFVVMLYYSCSQKNRSFSRLLHDFKNNLLFLTKRYTYEAFASRLSEKFHIRSVSGSSWCNGCKGKLDKW